MREQHIPDDLIQHLCRCSALTPEQAIRLATEVIHYFSSSPAQFVIERHHELQKVGLANAEIYALIEQELRSRLYCAPDMSIRQIRRLIYG